MDRIGAYFENNIMNYFLTDIFFLGKNKFDLFTSFYLSEIK